MRLREFEVAVVGAGPAGATVARELATSGIQTVLIERAQLPRYKSCAGGIPIRTARILPFPIDGVVEDTIAAIQVSHRGRGRFEKTDQTPFAAMVMRDRFDKLLVDHAIDAGAELVDACPVREIRRVDGGFQLQTAAGALRARLLVGADGANSIVARSTRLGAGLTEACALEAEIAAPTETLLRWRGRVNVDFGYQPSGYGWVFPKGRLLSVGLVRPLSLARRLHQELNQYLDSLDLAGAPVERIAGHKVLFRRAHEPIAGPGALLTGDAAGLVDEFTEEGIYYAIRSGQIAARVLCRQLESRHSWLGAYERAVDRELMPELRAARTIGRLFYGVLSRMPQAMLQLSERVDYLWRAFFRVQHGESSYADELNRARVISPLARWLLR